MERHHHTDDLAVGLDDLAWLVAGDGPTAHHDRLAAVARSARTAGIALVEASVLADPTAPAVARQRALGALARRLAAAGATPSPALHAVA